MVIVKVLGVVLGIALIVCSILGGVAFWAYGFFVLGVFQIIQSATSTIETLNAGGTVSAADEASLAWGIAWLFLAKIGAFFIIVIGVIVGALMAGVSSSLPGRRHRRTRGLA